MILDRLRIFLFGEPRFELRGEAFRFNAPPKTLPLLAYLLLHRRGPVARETLAALLWPDADQATAFANLRRHLHYLSKALPESADGYPWVLATKASIAWNPQSPYWLDVEAFETEIQEHQRRAHAVRLYSGDLYERCSEEWIDFERERLRTLQTSNLAQLCADAQKRSSYVEALQYAQLMLAADSWREDAVRTIMETRMLLGDRAGALAEYERFAARLRDELNTEPLAETAGAYQRIARAAQSAQAEPQGAAQSATLVGRRNELATLRAQWQRAARGEGCAAFIGGEAGIGKTTLLEALCEAAATSGGAVLTGAASAGEDGGYGALLAPSYAVGADLATPAGSEEERLRRFEAFAAALEARAEREPVLLAIEDVHWAGSATIDLLRYLVLRLAGARVLFAITYREFEVHRGHPLRTLRRQLAKMHRSVNVALSALGRDDVGELASLRAGRTLGDDLVRRIYERSDGNPLFVSEIVRELREGAHERVPASIAEIVHGRLQRLSAQSRSFLQTAAIAGTNLSTDLLVRVSGLREADVLQWMDELIAAHFLRQGADDTFSFVHEVIREAVYQSAGPDAARAVHARVGLALQRLYGDAFAEAAAAAARHFDAGGMAEAAAGAYLAAAEHALTVYALDEAAAYGRRALDGAGTERDRFRALRVLESVAGRLARRSEQREHLAQMLAMSEYLSGEERADVLMRDADFSSGEPPQRQRESLERLREAAGDSPRLTAAYLLRQGEYHSRVGEMHEAQRMLRAALDHLAAGKDLDALLRCLSALYVVALSTGDSLDDIVDRVNELQSALQHGADAGVAARLAFIRAAAVMDRDPARAAELSEDMLEHARQAGDVWMEALAHRSWGASATRAMQIGTAQHHLRRCAEMTIAAGRLRDLARVRSWQAMLANRCGDFAAAVRYGEEGIEASRACGATDLTASILSNLANTAVWAGDLATAEQRLSEALALCAQRGYAHPSIVSLRGEITIGKGDLDGGIAILEDAWSGTSPQEDALGTRRVHVPLLLGIAYAASGREARAREQAARIRDQLQAFRSFYIHPQVYLWSAAQLLRLLGFETDARAFADAARRRREEILATIDDAPSREAFCRFVFNELIERRAAVTEPLHAWFLPYAVRGTATPA